MPRTIYYRQHLFALLTVVLYGLGAIVLPSLHLVLHRNDHDHRGGGIHWHSRQAHLEVHTTHRHEHRDAGRPEAALPDSAEGARAGISQPSSWQRQHTPQPVTSLLSPCPPLSPLSGEPSHAGGSLVHFAELFFAPATLSFTPLVGLLPATADVPEYSDPILDAGSAGPQKARAPPYAAALL